MNWTTIAPKDKNKTATVYYLNETELNSYPHAVIIHKLDNSVYIAALNGYATMHIPPTDTKYKEDKLKDLAIDLIETAIASIQGSLSNLKSKE